MNIRAYISLALRIAALVPEVKHIDLFNQQYVPSEERKSEPFPRPAVFVEYLQTEWNYTMNNLQQGTGSVKIHVVMERYKASFNIQTKSAPEQAALMAHFAVVPKVHTAVQGWVQDGTAGSMQRTNITPDNNHDNLVIEIMDYAFIDQDTSADELAAMVPVTITDIDVEDNLFTPQGNQQIGGLVDEDNNPLVTN